MKDINKIIIVYEVLNDRTNILLSIFDKKIVINNKKIEYDENIIKDLLKIIFSWDTTYIDNNVIDGEKYNIKIFNKDSFVEYIGINSFPDNYMQFKEWLGMLNDK